MTREERLDQEIVYFTPLHPPAVEKKYLLVYLAAGVLASAWLVYQALTQVSTSGVTIPRVAITVLGVIGLLTAIAIVVKSVKLRSWSKTAGT